MSIHVKRDYMFHFFNCCPTVSCYINVSRSRFLLHLTFFFFRKFSFALRSYTSVTVKQLEVKPDTLFAFLKSTISKIAFTQFNVLKELNFQSTSKVSKKDMIIKTEPKQQSINSSLSYFSS